MIPAPLASKWDHMTEFCLANGMWAEIYYLTSSWAIKRTSWSVNFSASLSVSVSVSVCLSHTHTHTWRTFLESSYGEESHKLRLTIPRTREKNVFIVLRLGSFCYTDRDMLTNIMSIIKMEFSWIPKGRKLKSHSTKQGCGKMYIFIHSL